VPVPGEPEQTRWRIAARFKDGSNPKVSGDWTATIILPGVDEHRHDREPAAHVANDGSVQVAFASTRDGGWSVHRADLDLDPPAWLAPETLTGPPFSERAPLPLSLAGTGTMDAVCVRSNRSITRTSAAHAATVTVDRRWSGSTTVHTTDAAALALLGTYDDHLTYIYDTGRTDADRLARDTIGLFAQSSGATPEEAAAARERLRRVLPEFIPATDRAVLDIS
jgi:hypothetical protein